MYVSSLHVRQMAGGFRVGFVVNRYVRSWLKGVGDFVGMSDIARVRGEGKIFRED